MPEPASPGEPYSLLFDEDSGTGPGLPAGFQAIYGSDWCLPAPPDRRPFVYTNFVVSHDGRISFDEPGYTGGDAVSRHAPHDLWLMALLRARADAILTGNGTLRVAQSHRWQAWTTFPALKPALLALRASEGRSPLPALVVISGSGDLPGTAPALQVPGQRLIIATTSSGAERARAALTNHPDLHLQITPGPTVDLPTLLAALRQEYAINSLLSEGGARIYGQLLAEGLIDEVFTTISPIVVGNPAPPAPARTALIEGVAFSPQHPPRLTLISLRRVGNYLFQRARCQG